MGLFGKSETIVINVDGMTCEHCEMRVTNAAMGVKGVKDAKADKDAKQLTVTLSKRSGHASDQIVEAVNGLGYTAST